MERFSQSHLHKLDPKLRMVANGDEVVNTLRSEQNASLAVTDSSLLQSIPELREPSSVPASFSSPASGAERGTLEVIPSSVSASVFIELAEETKLPSYVRSRRSPESAGRHIITAQVPLNRLPELIEHPAVVAIQGAEALKFTPPVATSVTRDQPTAELRRIDVPAPAGGEGEVLIGIVDVQGYDFAHPDFLDENGQTRFVAIWDQAGTTRPGPAPFRYGSELTSVQINAALAGALTAGLPATFLEPQSQMVPGSHGTHVASIAAGNHGVCPKARIAAVLVNLPQEDTDRRKSFYDSTRLVDAVDYLFLLGETLNLPVSVNVSLGTNGHAHDGSSFTSRWIDFALANAGRSLCVAAGNAGQEAPAFPDDFGFVMGRIHTSGKLAGPGSSRDIEWVVVGNGRADLSENEMEIWYSPHDHFAVQLKPPGSGEWIGPLEPGQFIENRELSSKTFVSIYNELYSPSNGLNYIALYLSPFLSNQGVFGIAAGTWTVQLLARELRDGRYHAWIERDDPRRLGRAGMVEAWSFPSFLSDNSYVDNTSVGSLACGDRVISVANLDEARSRTHITSSQGPTRDGRQKPDIAAPGTDILAANGFHPDQAWIRMTGTSMASPYVTGVVGRMLARTPTLSAAQINAILCRTGRPLPRRSPRWRNDTGFGMIDPAACLLEAERSLLREDRT